MTIIYWLIVLFLFATTISVFYREQKTTAQITCLLLAIPLLLRLLGWK